MQIHLFLKIHFVLFCGNIKSQICKLNNLKIAGFERCSLLSNLEVLHLDGNNFNHSILQSLSGIASLKELDLSYNNLLSKRKCYNNLNGSIHIKGKTLINLQKEYYWKSDSCTLTEHVTFHVLFFNVEFKAFSNLEDLYLRGNEINAFVTTRGMIVCKNICSWIKIKYFFCMVCRLKLSH